MSHRTWTTVTRRQRRRLGITVTVGAVLTLLAIYTQPWQPTAAKRRATPTAGAAIQLPNGAGAGSAPAARPISNDGSPDVSTGSNRPSAKQPTTTTEEPGPSQRFLAVLPVAERLFILHGVEPQAAPRAPVSRTAWPRVEASTSITALTGGSLLVMQDRGPALQAAYTVADPQGSCLVTGKRSVSLQLDSGEPEADSALGPSWLADEVVGCELHLRSGVPAVAVLGHAAIRTKRANPAARSTTTSLPRRVMPQAETAGCEADAGEFVEAILELAGLKYALLRSSDSIDWVGVRPLVAGSQYDALNINTSLYWDHQLHSC